MHKVFCILTITIFYLFCLGGIQAKQMRKEGHPLNLEVTSLAFMKGGNIPAKYTCDGEGVSPPIEWSKPPDETKSTILISDDPDAPGGDWVHWVLYGLSPDTLVLPEGVPAEKVVLGGAKQGINGFNNIGYGGPCPPGGTHRYYFKVYALDTKINLAAGATKQQLVDAIRGHIVAEGQLMGRYCRD